MLFDKGNYFVYILKIIINIFNKIVAKPINSVKLERVLEVFQLCCYFKQKIKQLNHTIFRIVFKISRISL